MTENIEKTREELQAEIDALSTRDRSPITPTDHKPADADKIEVEYAGQSYQFDARSTKDIRTLFALRKDDMETVLVRILGEEAVERFIGSIEDEDGFTDVEKLAEFVQAIYKKAGGKNS